MNQCSRFSRVALGAVALFAMVSVSACGNDGLYRLGGFNNNNNFNPNPGGSPAPKVSCIVTYTLTELVGTATTAATLDQTFYFENPSASLNLASNTCPFAVTTALTEIPFGIGRYIGPDPFATTEATAAAEGTVVDVDLFGVFFWGGVVMGQATTINPNEISYAFQYPRTPAFANPACDLEVQFGAGTLAPSIEDASTYEADLTVPFILTHPTDVANCVPILAPGSSFQVF